MLPPPPKRTRSVTPAQENTLDGSASATPPPNSRDRRARRTAVQPIGAGSTSTSPFAVPMTTFTPISTFSPFMPMQPTQPFDDEPIEPEATEEASTQVQSQIEESEPSSSHAEATIDSEETSTHDTPPSEDSAFSAAIEDSNGDEEVLEETSELSETMANDDQPSITDDYVETQDFTSTDAPAEEWDPEEGGFGEFAGKTQDPYADPFGSASTGDFYDPEGGFIDHIVSEEQTEESTLPSEAEPEQEENEVIAPEDSEAPIPTSNFDDWGSESDFEPSPASHPASGDLLPLEEENIETAEEADLEGANANFQEAAYAEEFEESHEVEGEELMAESTPIETTDDETTENALFAAEPSFSQDRPDSPPLFESAGIPIPFQATFQSQHQPATAIEETNLETEDDDESPQFASEVAEITYTEDGISQSEEFDQETHDFEEGADETYCDIDSTSRRVLAALAPLDTSIHSIAEVDSEASSIASAEAIAEQRADLLSLMPTISEEDGLSDPFAQDPESRFNFDDSIEEAVAEAIEEENTFAAESDATETPLAPAEAGWDDFGEDFEEDKVLHLDTPEELTQEDSHQGLPPSDLSEMLEGPTAPIEEASSFEEPLFEETPSDANAIHSTSNAHLVASEELLFSDTTADDDSFAISTPSAQHGSEVVTEHRLHVLPSDADLPLFDSPPSEPQTDEPTETESENLFTEQEPAATDLELPSEDTKEDFENASPEPITVEDLAPDHIDNFEDDFGGDWTTTATEVVDTVLEAGAEIISSLTAPAADTEDSQTLDPESDPIVVDTHDTEGDFESWPEQPIESEETEVASALVSDSPLFEDSPEADQDQSASEVLLSETADEVLEDFESFEASPAAQLLPTDEPLSFDDIPVVEEPVIEDIAEPTAATIDEEELFPAEPSIESDEAAIVEELPITSETAEPSELVLDSPIEEYEEPHVIIDQWPHIEESYVDSLQSSAIINIEHDQIAAEESVEPITGLTEIVESSEEEISFTDLNPTEAEDLFNQYKDSLKEHQDTLKQLLDEREEMRLELEKVLLDYGPISELETRLEAYAVELDSVLARLETESEAPTGEIDVPALETEKQDLEEIIEKYKDSIARRFNDKTESGEREDEIVAQVSKIVPVLPSIIDAPASVADLSEATSPRVSSRELSALQDKLQERDGQISELSSRIDSSAKLIADLESDLEKMRVSHFALEEASKSKVSAIEGLEEEILQNENFSAASLASLPWDDLAVHMKVLTIAKVKAVVEATEMRNEVEELKRRLKIEISALDSQLAERETENVLLREQLSTSSQSSLVPTKRHGALAKDDFWDSPRDADTHNTLASSNSPYEDTPLATEIEKLRKSYDTTKAHLSKCEAELAVATTRAEQLDQLFKAECQLRQELQQSVRESKRSPVVALPPAALEERDRVIASLKGELSQMSVQIERAQLESADSSKKKIDGLMRELAASRSKESQIADHLAEMDHEKADVASLRSELTHQTQRLEKDQASFASREQEFASQQREFASQQREFGSQQRTLQQDQQELAKQRRKVEAQQLDMDSNERDTASSKLEASHHETKLQEIIAERDIHIQELELELGSLSESNVSLSSEIDQLKQTLSKLERRYQQLKKEAEESANRATAAERLAAEAQLAASQTSHQGSSTLATSDLEAKIADLEQRNTELENELSQAIQSHISAESSINEKSAYVQDLQSELESVTNALESVRSGMNSDLENEATRLQKEKAELLSRVQELETQIAEAQEALEAQRLSSQTALQVSDSEIDAITQELNFIRRELQESRDDFDALQLKAKEDAEKAQLVTQLEASNTKLTSDIADIQKQLDAKDKLMYEAYAAFESELGYTAEEIRSQCQPTAEPQPVDDTRLQSLTEQVATLQAQLDEETQKKATAEERIETLRSKFKASMIAAQAQFAADKASALEESESLRMELTTLAESLKTELEKANASISESDSLCANMEQQIASLEAEVLRLQALAESNATQGLEHDEKSSQELSDLRAQNESLTAMVQQLETSVDSYAIQVEDLSAKLHSGDEKATEIQSLTERCSNLEITNAELEQSQVELLQTADASRTESGLLREELEKANLNADSLQQSLVELRAELSEAHFLSSSNQETQAAHKASSDSEVARLTSLLEQSESSLASAQEELADQRAKADDFATEAEALRESAAKVESLFNENSAFLASQQETSQRVKDLESELEQSSAALTSKDAHTRTLEEKLEILAAENAALLADQQTANSRLTELEQLLEQASVVSAQHAAEKANAEESLQLHLSDAPAEPASATKSTVNFSMDFGDDWGADGDDAWSLDDPLDGGIVSTSPVEQQAELEYLREFLKTKTQECDSLKRQLAVASVPPSAPATASAAAQHIVIPSFKKSSEDLNASSAGLNKTIISDSPLFAPSSATSTLPGPSSSSLPASPYVAPHDRSINKSTSSLTPAANLFDSDDFEDGWGDVSFDPLPVEVSSAKKPVEAKKEEEIVEQNSEPAATPNGASSASQADLDMLREEVSSLKEKLASFDAAERHNESLKNALENRSNELSELAEEYEALQQTVETLKQSLVDAEAERDLLKEANEKLDADVHEALATATTQKQEFESKIEELNTKLEQASRAATIEKSSSNDKIHSVSPSPSAQILGLQAEVERSKTTIKTLQTLLASKPPSQTSDHSHSSQRPSTIVTSSDKINFDGDEDGWDNWDDSAPTSPSTKPEKTSENVESSSSAQAAQRLPILEREIQSLRHLLEQKDSDLSTLRVQVVDLKNEISDLQSQPKADDTDLLREANLRHEEEVAKLEARHAKDLEAMELKHIAASEESEFSASEALSQTVAKAKISAKAEVEGEASRRLQVVEETHTAQKELLENELATRANRISLLETDIDSLRGKLESTISQYESVQSQLKSEKSTSSGITSRATQLESDNHHLQLLVEELQQERNERTNKSNGSQDDDDLDGASQTALREAFSLQLEEAKDALVRAEATAEAARERGEDAARKVSTLNSELSSLQALLTTRDAQLVDVQSKLSTAVRERDQAQLDADENVLSVKEESRRLRTQVDRLKADLDRWTQREKEWKKDLDEARDAEAMRAAEVSVYLKRLESLQALGYSSNGSSLSSSQGIPGTPTSMGSVAPSTPSLSSSMYGNAQLADWVEKTLKSQSSIAEKLTTENAKLSKGLVSGLVDAQTPVERLAAAKQQLQMRVDRLEKDVRRMKTELTARTEERDTLRQQVDSLNTQKGDLARRVAASPASRLHSPAAHFSSYANPTAAAGPSATPLTPYSHNAIQGTVYMPSTPLTQAPPAGATTPQTSSAQLPISTPTAI